MATPKFMGIEIIGDYRDFRKLYESIQAVIEFKDKHDHPSKYKSAPNVSEQLRCLNYEIRQTYQGGYELVELENGSGSMREKIQKHFTQGCDDIEKTKENHSNLYYKVKIPYIEALSCTIDLMDILEEMRRVELAQKVELQNCNALWRFHWSTATLFAAVLDTAIEDSLGKSILCEMRCRNKKKRVFKAFDYRYIELLSSFYLTKCTNMSIKEKIEIIKILALLLLRIPKLDITHNILFTEILSTIPDYKHFAGYMKTQAGFSEDGEVYMDEIFGLVDWKGMDW
jgi:hypothetical protein